MRYVILPSPAAPLKGAVPIPHPYRRSSDCPAIEAIVADQEAALFLVEEDFRRIEPWALEADIFGMSQVEDMSSRDAARGLLVALVLGAVAWLATLSVYAALRPPHDARSPTRVTANEARPRMMNHPPAQSGQSDPGCPMTVGPSPSMITDPPTAPDDCR
jgi:hypothetical protein